MSTPLHFATRALKLTAASSQTAALPISSPLHLSTTFHRDSAGDYHNDFVYSRNDNPNRQQLEKSLASLESGAVAYAFGSGMAAIHAVFQQLQPGQHVLIPDDVYYNVRVLLEKLLKPWGLQYTAVDFSDLSQVTAAIKSNTVLCWLETPSNPQLKITDIPAVVALARQKNILVAVDNTWPSPVISRPIELGADIVVHSTTKYFGGHSDVMGGCVVLKEKNEVAEKIQLIQRYAGGIPAPFDCWLITRGIQSLHLRVSAQSQTAMALAEFLAAHPSIEQVNYPGLAQHPGHAIAKDQMFGGFGGMLSVLVKGDASNALRMANQLEHFAQATSLGGVESLVEHRRSVEGPNSLTPANLLRLSVGLEAAKDLIADWEQALSQLA